MSSNPRDRIVRTADRLMYANGIRAVGIDELIAEADVAKATFYRHFPSKEDVILAYLQDRSARLRQIFLDNLNQKNGSPEVKILAVFDNLSRQFASKEFNGCAFLKAVSEFPSSRAILRVAKDYKQSICDGFQSQLKGYKRAKALAEELALLYEGAIVQAVIRPDSNPVAHAKNCAEFLLANQR